MNRKHLRRGSAVLGAAAIVGLAGSTTASAATLPVLPLPFTCVAGGASITGSGSSFQNPGVQAAITAYASACASGPVAYNSVGSGPGIAAFAAGQNQFAGTDIPYNDTYWATTQAGRTSHFETIPIAVAGVAVAVNEPCAAGASLTGTIIGQIYAGKVTDWSQVVAGCSGAITPIHRSVSSGTTTAFKTYLTKKDPVDYAQGCSGGTDVPGSCYKDSSTTWPTAGSTCGGTTSTNTGMVSCLNSTTGGIIYVDQSQDGGLSLVNIDNADGALVDLLDLAGLHSVTELVSSTVPVYNTVFGFSEPAAGDCQLAASTQATPTTTAADWAQVDVSDSPTGYGDCTYTYQLAWDLPGSPGAGVASPAQAISISDFLSFETSGQGQAVFAANGYDALPPQVQTLAYAAATALLTSQ